MFKNPIYRLNVKDEAGLLSAIMKELIGNAYISVEGDLSDYKFKQIPDASKKQIRDLKRNTIIPREDFFVLPLEAETIDAILAEILKNDRFWENITHVQIEKNGSLEFGSYDNFSEDTFTGPAISSLFLKGLLEKGILKSFEPFVI